MAGRVIYIAPDVAVPAGGIRVLYRHVELLVGSGIDACVWHCAHGTRLEWFTSSAPVVFGSTLKIDAGDTLIVPEPLVFAGFDPAPGCRKVIYNQNHFTTFEHTPWSCYPAWNPPPPMWVSSRTSHEVAVRLLTVLPIQNVVHVPLAVDTDLFKPSEVREKKVTWMPRKRPHEAALLHALLAGDDRLAGVRLHAIQGMGEEETAAELGTTSVFIALGRDEGFGLPVAEALAAGCAVVGYPAGGGAELFEAPGTHAIVDSDVLGLVDEVVSVMRSEALERGRLASRAWVERTYPESAQLAALMHAVGSAQDARASGGKATHPWPQAVAARDR